MNQVTCLVQLSKGSVTNSLKIQDSNTNFKLQTDVASSPSHTAQLEQRSSA
jgi:hypothetical protein